MTHPDPSPTDGYLDDGVHLRLVWPQWEGVGQSALRRSPRSSTRYRPPRVCRWASRSRSGAAATSAEVRRILADINGAVDVVGLTIAEFIPQQVMHLQQLSARLRPDLWIRELKRRSEAGDGRRNRPIPPGTLSPSAAWRRQRITRVSVVPGVAVAALR